jgi:hypothetical protein
MTARAIVPRKDMLPWITPITIIVVSIVYGEVTVHHMIALAALDVIVLEAIIAHHTMLRRVVCCSRWTLRVTGLTNKKDFIVALGMIRFVSVS